MKLVAAMTERDADSLVSRTLVFDTGMLVSFSGPQGFKHGVHRAFDVEDTLRVLDRLRTLADHTNVATEDTVATFVSFKVPATA